MNLDQCPSCLPQSVVTAAVMTMPDDTPEIFQVAYLKPDPYHVLPNEKIQHFFLPQRLAGKPLPLDPYELDLSKTGSLPYTIQGWIHTLAGRLDLYRKDPERGPELLVDHVVAELGHFVGDASQPLTTARYPHPDLAQRFHKILGTLEPQVDMIGPVRQIKPEEMGHWVFSILLESNSHLDTLYNLEKDGQFNPDNPGPQGVEFARATLTRASRNLRDIYSSIWLKVKDGNVLETECVCQS